MWNVLTFAGAVIGLGGVVLAIVSLGAGVARIGRWWRSRRLPESPSVWAMAVPASAAYVPGSIRNRFLMVLLGLVIAALGAPIAWAGWSLADFAPAEPSTRLAESWVEGGGRLLVVKVRGGDNQAYDRPGRLLVAHAEYLRFPPWLEQARLGPHLRVTYISGYDSTLQVLEQRGRGRVDVQGEHPLYARLGWLAAKVPALGLEVGRRHSDMLANDATRAELWTTKAGDRGGLEWRR